MIGTRFEGSVVLVSGGGSGIGKAVARRFADEGAFVYICGRRRDVLDASVSEIVEAGGQARSIPTDVSNTVEVERLIDAIRREKGYLTTLVNAAGVLRVGFFHDMKEEDFDLLFQTNVKGLWLLTRAAIPLLRNQENANIIHLSSTAGTRVEIALGAYQASKAAVNTMTRVMAKELGPERIRVNAIAPGPIDTELYQGSIFGDDLEDGTRRREVASVLPFGRFGTPEEVARLALFLASPESDFISGSITTIDGALGIG